jgi:hypothetical protein
MRTWGEWRYSSTILDLGTRSIVITHSINFTTFVIIWQCELTGIQIYFACVLTWQFYIATRAWEWLQRPKCSRYFLSRELCLLQVRKLIPMFVMCVEWYLFIISKLDRNVMLIYRVSQGETSIFREVILSAILSKTVYVHVSHSEGFLR